MKKYLHLLTVALLAAISLSFTSCSDNSNAKVLAEHPDSKEIEVTNGGTTEKCEIRGTADYQSGEGYDCGILFDALISDFRPTSLSGSTDYSLLIKCAESVNELKEGDDITDSSMNYYNYMAHGNGRVLFKKGTVTVLKKSDNKITLKFDNFNFTTAPCSEEFGLNGTITFKLEE